MNGKYSALAAMFAFLLVASTLVALNAAPMQGINRASAVPFSDSVKPLTTNGPASTADQVPPEVEALRKKIPATYDEANALVTVKRSRYLMWTTDLAHVMWGVYGGEHFVGTDNLGKHVWGIYGKGYFAGFYDGHFFWGKFSNMEWKAQGLFGLRSCYGRYTLSPIPAITAATP